MPSSRGIGNIGYRAPSTMHNAQCHNAARFAWAWRARSRRNAIGTIGTIGTIGYRKKLHIALCHDHARADGDLVDWLFIGTLALLSSRA